MWKFSDFLACCSSRDKDKNIVSLDDRLKDFNAYGDDGQRLTSRQLAKLNRYQ